MKIETIGQVGVWWIERPAGPRVPPRVGLCAVLLVVPPVAAVLTWVGLRGEALWPWSTVTPALPSHPQYLLRYLLLLAGGVVYIVGRSVPAWVRLARTARADIAQAQNEVQSGRWEQAALHLHRHALLRGELSRRVDPAVIELDQAARPHLPTHRRLCIYYRRSPPPVPESPTAGFQPRVVPLSIAGGWCTGVIVAVLMIGALTEARDAWLTGQWQALGNLGFVVLVLALAVYAYIYTVGFLGRRSYFRFAPGIAELLQFKVRASKTQAETIALRSCDVFIDLTRPAAILAFVECSSNRRIAEYHLSRSPQTIETCLRAVLSDAPVHTLPNGELTG
ncbi:MAG: hypothetical protein KAV82_06560 [Phycisphaerae bacterium]|nr:hypothetical protein [Phycisphaerae bacterium]